MISRANIGVLLPSTNSVVLPDLERAFGSAVELIPAFMPTGGDVVSTELYESMGRGIRASIAALAERRVTVALFACTSHSFLAGDEWEADLAAWASNEHGLELITANEAVKLGLRALGVQRLLVATPYPDWVNQGLVKHYVDAGFLVERVISDAAAVAAGATAICGQPASDIADLVAEAALTRHSAGTSAREIDVVLCSCTGWQSMRAVADIEARLDLPCVTSNQALVWRLSQQFGLAVDPVTARHRLFAAGADLGVERADQQPPA